MARRLVQICKFAERSVRGEVETVNVLRVTTRNRRYVKERRLRFRRAAEDGILTPREIAEIEQDFDGQEAFATVIDIRDALGRPTTIERVQPLLDDYGTWVNRLPESA
jgi:hypothetical protein